MIMLSEIANLTDGRLAGKDIGIKGLTTPEDQQEGTVTIISTDKNLSLISGVSSAYILDEKFTVNSDKPIIYVKDTRKAMVVVLNMLYPKKEVQHYISKNSIVPKSIKYIEPLNIGNFVTLGEDVAIGSNTIIENGCSIGNNVKIGNNCIIYPNVTIYEGCSIGNNVIIHAGAVIGADGFGFIPDLNPIKIPQKGNVIVEDYVEIGANTCIDRATIGSTVIGFGTKLDNLVLVGHNTKLGKSCLIAGQVGFSGSITVGDGIIAGGQVGFSDHINIASGSIIGGQSGISNDIKSKDVYLGSPCMLMVKYAKSFTVYQELPDHKKRVKKIEQKNN